MAIGVGGQGYIGVAPETTPGTYVAPTKFIPILSESLAYTEDRYISPAIRAATIAQDVKQSYYHVEGDIDMEVDTDNVVFFLHASRFSVVKTLTGPYKYVYTPSGGASAGPNGNNATAKTLSITIVRNNVVFKYVGCVVGSYNFRVENGVLLYTATIMGLGETSIPADTPPAPTFTNPSLLGATAHTTSTAPVVTPPTVPSWVTATNFQTFQINVNENATAQNRISTSRQAAMIAFGETELTVSATRDFEVRADYDNFVATTFQAFQLFSSNGATTDSIQFAIYRGAYTAFPITLPGIGEIVVAAAEVRGVQNGTRSFDVTVYSDTNIT